MEESGFVFDMKQFWSEQLVELVVEVGVFKIVLGDQGEDSGEGEEGDGASNVVAGEEEVRHQERLEHEGKNFVIEDQKNSLVLIKVDLAFENL